MSDRSAPGARTRTRLVAAAALITFPLVAGACSAPKTGTLTTSEEPPIRVRNGSLDVELLASKGSNSWKSYKETDNTGKEKTKWKPEKGDRDNEVYQVVVGVLPDGACDHGTGFKGTVVRFTYQ